MWLIDFNRHVDELSDFSDAVLCEFSKIQPGSKICNRIIMKSNLSQVVQPHGFESHSC